MSQKEILAAVQAIQQQLHTLDVRFNNLTTEVGSLKAEVGSLKAEVGSLKAEVGKRLDKLDGQVGQLIKWTQRQDLSLEHEMTQQLVSYLQEKHKGFVSMENKDLPKTISINGQTLTDLDGVIVMSDSSRIQLVVLEAKQHITLHKMKMKLRQKEQIELFIQDIKADRIAVPSEFEHFSFETCSPIVGLYIGAIEFKEGVKEGIQAYAETHDMCGLVELNGSRFSVNDVHNDFGKQKYGGKRNPRS
jgi:regulator of replication initiation timing